MIGKTIRIILFSAAFLLPASSFAKIGLDINGGALIHKQHRDWFTGTETTSMGGAGAIKVTYQAKRFEVGPYAEYGGMQQASYLLAGATANALFQLTDFQLYVGATGGYASIGSATGSSIGAQVGGRFPIFSNLHFNTELSFRRVNADVFEFNAFGIMAGFHVKF